MRSKTTTLLSLAALSGVFGINYEVVFFRLITAQFGEMLHVQAAVLAMFLLGVAIGSLAGHRLRLLWALEVLVGVTSLGVSLALARLEAQPWLAFVIQRPLLTTGLCMLLVAVPATLIGCSIPLFSEYVTRVGQSPGNSPFRRVYGLYNLGAALSVLATEYVLVRELGNIHTLGLLASGNILVGLTLFFLFPQFRRAPAQSWDAQVSPGPRWRRTLLSLLLLGCASSVFQMVFIRAAVEILGNSRQVFALTLALVLGGIPIGVRLASRLGLKDVIHLAIIGIALGFTLLPLLEALYVLAFSYGAREPNLLSLPGVQVVWRLAIVAPLGLLPFACFGAILPLALKDKPSSARWVGQAMFLNGVGNAGGYLLFIGVVNNLFSELGQLVVVIALAQVGLALGMGSRAYLPVRRNKFLLPATAAVVVLGATFTTTGYYARQLRELSAYRVDEALSGPRTMDLHLERRDGTSAGIIHYRDDAGLEGKRLFYSGHQSIAAVEGGRIRQSEVLSGVLPALFAPSLRRAAVIGIGTGITAGTTARIFEHTDAVEISSAIIALLPRFSDANFDLVRNPAARIVHNDARAFLAPSRPVYDVILNSVSVPSFEAASKIYTTEFFHIVKRSLAAGGVYMTWIGMNDTALDAVLGALRTTFRYCFASYLAPEYFMLTCADRLLRPRDLSSVSLSPEIVGALARYPARGADLSAFVGSLHLTDDFLATVPITGVQNTDDLPVAEFAAQNPRARWTHLRFWPRQNRSFLTTDYVHARQVTGEQLWDRCKSYQTDDLRSACAEIPSLDSVFVQRLVNDGLMLQLHTASADRIANMRARWKLIERVAAMGAANPTLRSLGDSLVLALADSSVDDAEVQYAASRVAARTPGGTSRARLYRYRAFALDHRFRTFESGAPVLDSGGTAAAAALSREAESY